MQKPKSRAGRKPKNGKAAMTPAQRQKAYRDRKAAKKPLPPSSLDLAAIKKAADYILSRIYFLDKISDGWDRRSYFNGVRAIRALERTLEEQIRLPLLGEAAKDSRFWQNKAESSQQGKKFTTDL